MSDQSQDRGRLPPLSKDVYTEEQREAHRDFMALRKVDFSGPWHVLIRSPELLTHAAHMGAYLRYRSELSGLLSNLAILLVAREWGQDFEFAAHSREGAAAGLSADVIEAIRDGRRPEGLDADAQIVVDFVNELIRRKSVSDATWARALERFGEKNCVELCGIVGYYGFLAAILNAARMPPPPGAERLRRFPD